MTLFSGSQNEKLKELEQRSQKLMTISNNFHKLLKSRDRSKKLLHVACFYEQYTTSVRGVNIGIIVEKNSASLSGVDPIPVADNHRGMYRFEDRDRRGYQDASGILKRWIKTLDEPPVGSEAQVS